MVNEGTAIRPVLSSQAGTFCGTFGERFRKSGILLELTAPGSHREQRTSRMAAHALDVLVSLHGRDGDFLPLLRSLPARECRTRRNRGRDRLCYDSCRRPLRAGVLGAGCGSIDLSFEGAGGGGRGHWIQLLRSRESRRICGSRPRNGPSSPSFRRRRCLSECP